MRKLCILAFVCLAFAFRLPAQNGITGNLTAQTTDCTVTNACLVLDITPNVGGATIKLSGTWSGTVQFEVSADPLTVPLASAVWVSISATPSNSTTTATSATGNGAWQVNLSGYQRVRIRVSSFVSGTIAGAINLSTASARGGGGGGGSGSITGCTTTGGVLFENGTNNTATCGAALTWLPATNGDLQALCDPTTVGSLDGTCMQALNQGTVTGTVGSQSADAPVIDVTINSPNTTSDFYTASYAVALAEGSGTFSGGLNGVLGQAANTGSGSVATLAALVAKAGANSGGGSVTANYGVFSDDQSNIGTTNYDYFAPATTMGAGTNYQFYAQDAGTSHFGNVTLTSGNYSPTLVICSGQISLSTSAISSGTRATNTLTCTGLSTSTDSVNCTFSGDTNAVTGYAPNTNGMLTLKTYVTTNTVNVDQINNTGNSITPGAATVNCKGLR